VVQSIHEDATSVVRVNRGVSKAFGVIVGDHQGSVLSPLRFVILSREFTGILPMQLLYFDDLVSTTETEELLVEKIQKWEKSMEEKGLRVNLGKTKAMKCEARFGIKCINEVRRFSEGLVLCIW